MTWIISANCARSSLGFKVLGKSIPTNCSFLPGVAWWVGWVEKETEVYFFAFNMDIDNESKLPLRKSIPTKIMESEGIIGG